MPGLSQLKQFNKDILSLGDEVSLRAQRGEKPVIVSIPKSIKDENDSEDFIMGMPEIEAIVQDNSADDDLSDLAEIAGLSKPAENKKEETPAPSFQAPDLSSLLAPMPSADDGDMGMPDLSDFMEPEEEEAIEEAEPEPPSIADMSLEDLLGGAGFDGSSVETIPQEEETASTDEEEFYSGGFGDENYIPQKREPPKRKAPSTSDFEDVDLDSPKEQGAALSLEELGLGGLDNAENTATPGDALDIESFDEPEELGDVEDLDSGLDDLELPADDIAEAPSDDVTPIETETLEMPGDDLGDIPTDDLAAPAEDAGTDLGGMDFDFGDLSMPDDLGGTPVDDISLPTDDLAETPVDDISLPTDDLAETPADDISLPTDDLELPADDIAEIPSDDVTPIETETLEMPGDDLADIPTDDLADIPTDDLAAPSEDAGADLGGMDFDFGDLSMPDDLGGTPAESPADDLGEISAETPADDISLPIDDLAETPADDISLPTDDLELPADDIAESPSDDVTPIETETLEMPGDDLGDIPADDLAASTEDLGLPDDLGDMPPLEESPELTEGFGSDFSATDGLDDLGNLGDITGDLSMPDNLGETPVESAADDISLPTDDLGDIPTDDLGTSTDDLGLPDDFGESPAEDTSSSGAADFGDMDFGIPDGLFNAGDVEGETPDISEEVPDFGADDLGSSDGNQEEDVALEIFDTSEMEGMEFNIPDTDSQIGDSGFELGNEGDFGIEGQDFEIPGFSDVETAKEERGGSILSFKKQQSNADEELPPNTLSDAQYKQFLKNLSEYPLNVRLAFEDLIVKNEFTDEAEFEIIEKILNKSSARSVASMLEKMLDISIPVPRDYEHRTAEEYEAYKKSLSYQLKNKIIPGVFAAMILLVVGFGIFQFGKNCIYIPAKANSLYKQGYALLEADEYPQSEIKFTEATSYRLNKNWFFKYARGYREHKQYSRAEWMYQNILNHFKHNKEAGLEYARMELEDLANYSKAEEICRREILDFHINDADGILLLGDIFLEWGTEKDPEMLEKAREQYATLIQLYKPNNLYQSRMMRYFIRTDNLRNVLQLKEGFIGKEKSLGADDWAELSGYLMDKLYGPIAPSDEYLRTEIEDVRLMLMRAVKLAPTNPIATYNLSRYFIETNEINAAKETLTVTIDNFKGASRLHKRDIYKYIDSYRLLGEQYAAAEEYMRAQEYYTEGISLYTAERDASGFQGTKQIGVLFADQASIDYFISGDFENALNNYKESVKLQNDNPSIRYRIGYINYKQKNYAEALGSFMKAGDGNIKETNLMLAMANTLSLRGDNYAAQGYYEDLISNLDMQIADKGIVLPQTGQEDYDLVTTYLYAANNYGVTLYRLASRTGNSSFNAEAIVQLSQSVRAWDALTRNQETLVRLGGSNLAEENIKYITHPVPDFEPAIYTEIPRILLNTERF